MKRLFRTLVAAGLSGLAGHSAAAQDWRFCIGVAPSAHEAVITEIFTSAADSAQLERRFESYFRARKGRALTFQCPNPAAERLDALNAQTAALVFNRSMGFSVSSLPSAETAAIAGAPM